MSMSTSGRGDAGLFDRQAVLRRLGGDEKLLGKLVEAYAKDIPLLLGRLREAVSACDVRAVSFHACSVKGASLAVGAFAIHGLAVEIDRHARIHGVVTAADSVNRLGEAFDAFLSVARGSRAKPDLNAVG